MTIVTFVLGLRNFVILRTIGCLFQRSLNRLKKPFLLFLEQQVEKFSGSENQYVQNYFSYVEAMLDQYYQMQQRWEDAKVPDSVISKESTLFLFHGLLAGGLIPLQDFVINLMKAIKEKFKGNKKET